MKTRFSAFLLFVLMAVEMNAQNYTYQYEGQPITLTAVDPIKLFAQAESGQVVGITYPSQYSYYSRQYNLSNGSKAVILPRIIFKMNPGYYAYQVPSALPMPSLFTGLTTVDATDRVYYITCDFSTYYQVLYAVQVLYNTGMFEWCEPEMLLDVTPSNNNPLFSYQYYLKNTGTIGIDINAEQAWGMVSNLSGLTVAVVDDGVEHDHEDMSNVLDGYTAWNGVGSTGIGEPENESTTNTKGHGTSVAGLIGADDNTLQTIGVAPGVGILPVNIFPYEEDKTSSIEKCPGVSTISIMQAILSTYQDADIINLSWNIKDPSNAIAYAIKKAYTDGRSGLGCVVVGSSGNWYDYGNGLTGVSFPASMDEVIAVGAINNNGSGWYYSQRGSLLELVAPSGVGVNVAGQAIGDVVTLDRMGTMGYHTYNFTGNFGGTSVSCALVSGVAALVLSKAPELTVAEVRSILQTSASDLGPIGFDNTFGYGLVNAYEAVRQASSMHLQKVGGGSVMSSSKQSLDLKPVGINTFRIDLPNEASVSTGMWKVTVSDIATGCCVYTETTDGSAGCLIDGSIWKSGIYVVDASSETGHVTGKLSIRR